MTEDTIRASRTPSPSELATRWRLSPLSGVSDATDFIEDAVRSIGAGFHIDTSFRDYVSIDRTSPVAVVERLFSRPDARVLNLRLEEACQALGLEGLDPYGVALDAVLLLPLFLKEESA